MTEEVDVIVRPGDSWAAYPNAKPPMLTFRLADVAVIGDSILGVTAHEVAHLLYTDTRIKWAFDVSKKPRAAHLLLNAVEDARIERVFAGDFPGAQSLFDRIKDEAYDYKVQRGFGELPIKWRFILNIDRVLHGLEPWGDQRDLEAVEKALDDCLAAMWSDTTQEAADHLVRPYIILLELLLQEQQEQQGKRLPQTQVVYIPPELLEDLGLPADYEMNAPMDDEDEADQRTGVVSDSRHPGADADDHQVGGQDATQGKREKADGSGDGEGGSGKTEADADGGSGSGGEATDEEGGRGAGSVDWDAVNDRYSGLDDDTSAATSGDDKPTNIVEEMVQEEKAAGSTNKAIDILSYRQRHRSREAKEVEKTIKAEEDAYWDELNKLWSQHKADNSFRDRMRQNQEKYLHDRTELIHEIGSMRTYARSVLRDNAIQRFAGNNTSGRKIKTHRLSRMLTDDPRLFERKEDTGGKSYDICLVVDQSTSMRGYQQTLAYKASLVFLEAFDGIVGTSVIGFSDLGYGEPDPNLMARYGGAGYRRNYVRRWARQAITHRTYKGVEDDLRKRWATVPELAVSFNSTPMDAGVLAAIEQLRGSQKEVKAIVVLTDGQPNDPESAMRAFKQAQRIGIECYGLHIVQRSGSWGDGTRDNGYAFLLQACDRAVQVRGTTEIPTALNRLLRGVVRQRRVAAR